MKIKSKWIKDLNVRPEAIKPPEESTGNKLLDISLSNIFPGLSPQARATKPKINNWNYIKRKRFRRVKETFNKMKRQPTEWEKIFAKNISNKGSVFKYIKNLYNFSPKNLTI